MTDFCPENADIAAMMRNLLHAANSSTLTPVRKLSILCWYGFLARQAGTSKAGSLERLFEPSAISIGRDGCTEQRKNKWRNFRDGRYKPHKKLVHDVDRRARGSARVLDHPLWKICDPNDQSAAKDPEFIRQLSIKVQKIIDPDEGRNRYFQSGVDLSRQHRRALCKISSLDSLAAITWIIRSSSVLTTIGPSQAFYGAHDILMTLSAELHELGIASALLDHYIKWILPLALPKGITVDLTPTDYILISLFTANFMKVGILARGEMSSKEKVNKEIFLAQDLKKDFILYFALSARLTRSDHIEANDIGYDCNSHNKLRDNALGSFMDSSLAGYLSSSASLTSPR